PLRVAVPQPAAPPPPPTSANKTPPVAAVAPCSAARRERARVLVPQAPQGSGPTESRLASPADATRPDGMGFLRKWVYRRVRRTVKGIGALSPGGTGDRRRRGSP